MLLVTATIYHATPEQTDSTPHITASGKHINMEDPQSHRWIAVSRDLEAKGYTFGVKVIVTGAGDLDGVWTIEGTGIFDGDWTVQDRMNRRWTSRIDFLVSKKLKGGKWENVTIEIKR